MISDSHMHTSFSTDSQAAPEVMVEAAIAKGMKSICITDHHDMDMPIEGFLIEPEEYWKKMTEIRETYADRIRVRIGVEIGLQPHLAERIRKFAAAYPYDYVIGSAHLVDGVDPYYRDQLPITDEEMYGHYFDFVLECLEKTDGYQSLGHLDYVVRYGYKKQESYDPFRYMDTIDRILKTIIERGIILEVNTAGFKKDLGFPNPHPVILKRYRELGGEAVTIGADAHAPEYVGYAYEAALGVIRESGIRYIAEFTGKKPEFLQIENEMS